MFVELLDRLSKYVRTILNSQSSSERAILAALAAQDAKITDIVREQITQRFWLQDILTAVTLPPAASATLTFELGGKTIEGDHIKMKVAQNSTGTFSVTLKNAAGGPGQVDGVPSWTAAPDGVVSLAPAADGLSCVVTTLPLAAGSPAASAVVTFDADGDLGDGVKDIVATAAITVFDPANDAVTADITAGEFTPIG